MVESDITIRKAVVADAEMLADMGRRTFLDAFATTNQPEHMEQYAAETFAVDRIQEELEDPETDFFVAVRGESCVGYAKIRTGDVPDRQTDVVMTQSLSGTAIKTRR